MGRIAVSVIVSSRIIPISILFVALSLTPAWMRHSKSLRRAQRYCNGNFTTWDPMITTSPEVEEQPVESELPKYRDRAKERREDQNPDYEASELGSFHVVAPLGTMDLLPCC